MSGTRQLPLALGHRPAHGAEDFIVAPSNEAAVGWIDRWPDWPAPVLVVYGEPGSGKTHLVRVWQARSGAVLADPRALSVARVPQTLGARLAAVVDFAGADPDAAAGRAPVDEMALLHLYNLLAERRGNLLVAARRAPSAWSIAVADLRSRLLAAPAVALGKPDDALLEAVLAKLFADRQLACDGAVTRYLLRHMERSIAAARAVVAALDREALAQRRAITVKLAREVLRAGGGPADPDATPH